MVKEVVTPRAAATQMRALSAAGGRPGILFGPERTGLESDEVSVAEVQVSIPLNPGFNSLNLAQAVLVMGYEWWQAADETPERVLVANRAVPATKSELLGFFSRLEGALDACGFLRDPEMRPTMVRNIRAIFQRAGLMRHEVNTLQGIVTGLTERPHASPAPGSRAAKKAAAGGGPGQGGGAGPIGG
jgi:tRNA/rRNA methyltransferase